MILLLILAVAWGHPQNISYKGTSFELEENPISFGGDGGSVWKVKDINLVVKITNLKKSKLENIEEFVQRNITENFHHDLKVNEILKQYHLSKLNVALSDDRKYLVKTYVAGGSLHSWIQKGLFDEPREISFLSKYINKDKYRKFTDHNNSMELKRKMLGVLVGGIVRHNLSIGDLHGQNILWDNNTQSWEIVDGTLLKKKPSHRDYVTEFSYIFSNLTKFFDRENFLNTLITYSRPINILKYIEERYPLIYENRHSSIMPSCRTFPFQMGF